MVENIGSWGQPNYQLPKQGVCELSIGVLEGWGIPPPQHLTPDDDDDDSTKGALARCTTRVA